jgi:hypothetical protein
MIVFEIMSTNKHTKPKARIVQGNPTLGNNFCTISGIIIPPVALPDAHIPSARLLRFWK